MDQPWLKFLPSFIRIRIEGRHNLQKAVTNTGWLFADKIVRMGVGLVVGAWVARYLGPDQFGIYNYAIALVALLAPLATLGLDGIVVRTILREPTVKEEILGTAFILKFAGAVVTFSLSAGVISFLRPGDGLIRSVLLITAAGMVFQAFDTIDFWFQSQVQSRYTVIARNAAFLIVSNVKIVLILTHASLIAFAWAGLAEIIIGAIGLLVSYRLHRQYLHTWRLNFERAKSLLRDSWPLILSGLAIMIYVRIDQLMLGEMIGLKEVGIYSAATKISEIWYFIPVAIVTSVTPSIIEKKNVSETAYYYGLQKTFDVMAVLAYSIAIPMTFLSGYLIRLLYGANFQDAGNVLAIHIWAGLFVFLGVARGIWIIAEGVTKIALVTTAIGAAANVILNLFLIPRYGAIGSALATVGSYGFSDYVLFILVPRLRKIGKSMTNALLLRFIVTGKNGE